MKRFAKWIAHRILGPYAIYRIYMCPDSRSPEPTTVDRQLGPLTGVDAVAHSPDRDISKTANYIGEGSRGFGAWVDGDLVAVCWCWTSERCRGRILWPLGDGEAFLVQVTTAERYRGRGIAPALVTFVAARMAGEGYGRLFASIWFTHRSSIAAFEKAGWAYVGLVIEVRPFGMGRPMRIVHHRRRAGHVAATEITPRPRARPRMEEGDRASFGGTRGSSSLG